MIGGCFAVRAREVPTMEEGDITSMIRGCFAVRAREVPAMKEGSITSMIGGSLTFAEIGLEAR